MWEKRVGRLYHDVDYCAGRVSGADWPALGRQSAMENERETQRSFDGELIVRNDALFIATPFSFDLC